MYNVHLPIMLEGERQAVYRERERKKEVTQRLDVDVDSGDQFLGFRRD